ncbi:hypothetical protein PCE1_003388 [Barthelona sp. PCE]
MPELTDTKFSELGLANCIIKNTSAVEFKFATPVQAEIIPKILDNKTVIGNAQTGSGKTAAFALPIIHHLIQDAYGIFALVILPTRELAQQVYEQFEAFGAAMGISINLIIGGSDRSRQKTQLMTRPEIVICTIGRLLELIEDIDVKRSFRRMRYLVLDEADFLFENQFDQLNELLNFLPKNRQDRASYQTLLFTATMTPAMESLTEKVDAVYRDNVDNKVVDNIKQQYILVPNALKEVKLLQMATDLQEKKQSAIIFVNHIPTCEMIARLLREFDIAAVSLHSSLTQSERFDNLRMFKSMSHRILVATDVASRGIDIPDVDRVIHFHVPFSTETYIHRCGRCARGMFREGESLLVVGQREIDRFEGIEAGLGIEIEGTEYTDKERQADADETGKVIRVRRLIQLDLENEGYYDK